jgi:hypothetical protein
MFTLKELEPMLIRFEVNDVLEQKYKAMQHALNLRASEKYQWKTWHIPIPKESNLDRAYRIAREGRPLFDLVHVMGTAALKNGYPALGIAKSLAEHLHFEIYQDRINNFAHMVTRFRSLWKGNSYDLELPIDYCAMEDSNINRRYIYRTIVPRVPAYIQDRLKYNLRELYTLWEVNSWTPSLVPQDPLLCRRIGGWLFEVVDAWDVTALEASLFGS